MIKLLFYIFLIFNIPLYAIEFKLASYNVENMFDLKYDGTEYKEYIPNTKYWNKKSHQIKLHNISKVIKDLNAHIIGLQEIESQKAFDELKQKINIYKYGIFLKNKTASVGVGILSKYKILNFKKIEVNKYNSHSRYILKITIIIEHKPLILYVNHWRSKKASESKRILYATALKNEIDTLKQNEQYIILGDLNSNYDEYITFKYDKKLNDTYDITGINQILNTTIKGNFIDKYNLSKYKQKVHYNLWLDLDKKNRFSSIYKSIKNTPDHIIISSNMINGGISYKQNSFKVFKPTYLIKKYKIKRWNKFNHKGYSDHLPIYATFTTNFQKQTNITHIKTKTNTISYLYSINKLLNPIKLYNIKVIYKYKNSAIILRDEDKAILLFNCAYGLKVGLIYDITVNTIDNYFGLKEIKEISNIYKKNNNISDVKKYYLDARKIDIFNSKYQNSIIKNLRGTFNKNYLHFKHNKEYKIKLFFDKKIKRPKQNQTITITSGHLNIYKSKIQIRIHKQSDFK